MTVDGGAGNDAIWTGAGNDMLIGGTGTDNLWAGGGDDTPAWHDSSALGGELAAALQRRCGDRACGWPNRVGGGA
jgi:Ca2+-binding RTX toxin-like protein